jgi:AcrR family transcriptional regulator
MDPRFRRSRDALRAAVLEFAAAMPVADLSVTAICRKAGLTRTTFYQHAASPVDLLADALGDEIAQVIAAFQDDDGSIRAGAGFRDSERALLQHIADRALVYRGALSPHLLPQLRANIERVIRAGLVAHLRRYPQSLPAGVAAGDEGALSLLAAYAAGGTVAAIELWLVDEPADVDRGVRLILAASPDFWFAGTGEPRI